MFKRGKFNGPLSVAVGTGLAVLSIALTAWDGLWNTLGVAADQKSIIVTSLAILFVNLGFLVGVYFQQNDFKAEVLESQRNELLSLRHLIPSIRVFATYTGEAAMSILTSVLPTTAVALNTRI